MKFNGRVIDAQVEKLSQGAERMAVLGNAIRLADEGEDGYWRLYFRYRYACEASFHDDPTKAMPVAAEFSQIFEENPEPLIERSPDGAVEMYLMITEMGIEPIISLPQIPMSQWEELMNLFWSLVQRYHRGLRVYWWQMCQFWQYVDQGKAFTYFQKFWKTGRDSVSDCRACERSYAVQMSLLMGDRKAADEYAKPMEAGRIWFCSHTPHKYWVAYLEDALNRGDLKEAETWANKLYRKSDRDKNDLSYLGAILRCWAYTDPDRALELLERRLSWTKDMWDQKRVYDFYKGAWAVFQRLAKQRDTVEITLPEHLKVQRENGVWQTEYLAEWFHKQAAEIGAKFDQRNGSDYFAQDLALTLACGK